MTEAEAIDYVTLHADTESFPVLSEDEVTAIVEGCLLGVVWEDDTDYTYGQVIQPTVPNGHLYRVEKAGTSGTTEPTWTVELDAKQSDGSITWREFRSDPDGNLYDVKRAVSEAWALKATKAVQFPDSTEDGVKDSQVYEHCKERARFYAPPVY